MTRRLSDDSRSHLSRITRLTDLLEPLASNDPLLQHLSDKIVTTEGLTKHPISMEASKLVRDFASYIEHLRCRRELVPPGAADVLLAYADFLEEEAQP